MGMFKIKGIEHPGRINVKVDGRFKDVDLYEASDEVLEKLYADGCPYVVLTPEEFLKRNPTINNIEIKRIDIKKRAKSAKQVDR
jgi:hypothetical protein